MTTAILDMTSAKLIDINTQTVDWSCKVRVVQKDEPRNAVATRKMYMTIIFEDENVNTECDKLITCMHCGEDKAISTPRCRLDVEIADETGRVAASIFGNSAERILGLKSKQVMELDKQGQKLPLQKLNNRLQHEEYIVQLRSQSYGQQDNSNASYTIVSLHDADHYILSKKRTSNEDEDNDKAPQKRIKQT